MIYTYINIVLYFFIRKSQQGYIRYNKQLKSNFYKKVFTGVFSLFFLFNVLGEPFAMNNGENEGNNSRQHSLVRNSLRNTSQLYDSESQDNENRESPTPDPSAEALFAAFLSAHGGDTLEEVSSSRLSCSCFGPMKRCCESAFGKSCCMFTCIFSSIGGLGGAGVGFCMELLSKSVSNVSPTVISPTATTTTSISLPIGAIASGLACCIICGSLGCICSFCTKQRNPLDRIRHRMDRLRLLSSIRQNIREEQGLGLYTAFNARSQSVTTQPRPVGSSDSGSNSVVTSQPLRGSSSDLRSSYIPGEHQRGENGNSSEGADEGNDDEHIYETIGDDGSAVGGNEEHIYEEVGFYTTDFIPGYSYEGQVSSLLGMQCVLMDISIQVPQKLRRLALKAYEKIPEMYSSLQDNKVSSPSVANYGQLLKITKNSAKQNQSHIPYHVFAFTDNYESNLECKVRSSQAGVITELCTGVHLGLTYSRHNDEKKEYTVMQLDEGRGSVKAKSEIESIAAVVTFNADLPGITGHFASCYGWGKVKNKRFFTHAGSETSSSGSPAITITGGLVQVGYNLYVSKICSVTPYLKERYR